MSTAVAQDKLLEALAQLTHSPDQLRELGTFFFTAWQRCAKDDL